METVFKAEGGKGGRKGERKKDRKTKREREREREIEKENFFSLYVNCGPILTMERMRIDKLLAGSKGRANHGVI